MLQSAERVDDKFREVDIDGLFSHIKDSDFNDNYYLQLALMEQMIFVTNDGKIPSQIIKVPIITGNPALIAQKTS